MKNKKNQFVVMFTVLLAVCIPCICVSAYYTSSLCDYVCDLSKEIAPMVYFLAICGAVTITVGIISIILNIISAIFPKIDDMWDEGRIAWEEFDNTPE